MSLVDRIKETLSGDDDDPSFRYHCRDCDTEFEASERSRMNVACPSCGADGPRSVSKL